MQQIIIVNLNPAYDLLASTPLVQRGMVNNLQTLDLFPSGKGVNVAKVLADLGLQPQIIGFYGQDNKEGFDEFLEANHIQNLFLALPGRTRTNIKLREDEDNVVTELNFSGFTVRNKDWQNLKQACLNLLSTTSQDTNSGLNNDTKTSLDNTPLSKPLICITGSLPLGLESQHYKELVELFISQGCEVLADTSGKALEALSKVKGLTLKPNRQEVESLCQQSFTTPTQMLEACQQLVDQGLDSIILSLGAEGLVYISKDTNYKVEVPKLTKVVSPVGAGDTLLAGYIYGKVRGLAPADTLAFAGALATHSCTQGRVGKEGDDPRLLEQIVRADFLPLVKITKINQ